MMYISYCIVSDSEHKMDIDSQTKERRQIIYQAIRRPTLNSYWFICKVSSNGRIKIKKSLAYAGVLATLAKPIAGPVVLTNQTLLQNSAYTEKICPEQTSLRMSIEEEQLNFGQTNIARVKIQDAFNTISILDSLEREADIENKNTQAVLKIPSGGILPGVDGLSLPTLPTNKISRYGRPRMVHRSIVGNAPPPTLGSGAPWRRIFIPHSLSKPGSSNELRREFQYTEQEALKILYDALGSKVIKVDADDLDLEIDLWQLSKHLHHAHQFVDIEDYGFTEKEFDFITQQIKKEGVVKYVRKGNPIPPYELLNDMALKIKEVTEKAVRRAEPQGYNDVNQRRPVYTFQSGRFIFHYVVDTKRLITGFQRKTEKAATAIFSSQEVGAKQWIEKWSQK